MSYEKLERYFGDTSEEELEAPGAPIKRARPKLTKEDFDEMYGSNLPTKRRLFHNEGDQEQQDIDVVLQPVVECKDNRDPDSRVNNTLDLTSAIRF